MKKYALRTVTIMNLKKKKKKTSFFVEISFPETSRIKKPSLSWHEYLKKFLTRGSFYKKFF